LFIRSRGLFLERFCDLRAFKFHLARKLFIIVQYDFDYFFKPCLHFTVCLLKARRVDLFLTATMTLSYQNTRQVLTIQNSFATLEGSEEDDDNSSVMAEHQNQDVDSQLAQLVVDSTTSVDGTKQTYDNASVERKPSSDNTESNDFTLEDKVKVGYMLY